MRKKYILLLNFIIFFLFVPFLLGAEKINNYDVTVQINKNGSLTINEIIEYEFDNLDKRGIKRYIPLREGSFFKDIKPTIIQVNWIKRE